MNKKQILYPNIKDGIYKYEYVTINGIKQYIQIRGDNKDNPVLLVVHGGPGGSLAGLSHIMQRTWEQHFTVVNFDQRNTCKTYFANKDKAMEIAKQGTIDDYIKDIKGVIEYLHKVINFEKLTLLGFSWGTVIGSEYAKTHPEDLDRYIGVGQIIDFKEAFMYICDEMAKKALNDAKISAQIKNIKDIYPENENMDKNMMILMRRFAMMATKLLVKHSKAFPMGGLLKSPYLSFKEKLNMLNTNIALFEQTYETLFKFDFRTNMQFEIPVLFVTGNEDINAPIKLLEDCFEEIIAPNKNMVCINDASHMCFYDQPEKFLSAIR